MRSMRRIWNWYRNLHAGWQAAIAVTIAIVVIGSALGSESAKDRGPVRLESAPSSSGGVEDQLPFASTTTPVELQEASTTTPPTMARPPTTTTTAPPPPTTAAPVAVVAARAPASSKCHPSYDP